MENERVTCGRADPGQPKGAVGEVAVREDVGKTERVMIGQWVQVQEVTDIDVGLTEGRPLKLVRTFLCFIGHYL